MTQPHVEESPQEDLCVLKTTTNPTRLSHEKRQRNHRQGFWRKSFSKKAEQTRENLNRLKTGFLPATFLFLPSSQTWEAAGGSKWRGGHLLLLVPASRGRKSEFKSHARCPERWRTAVRLLWDDHTSDGQRGGLLITAQPKLQTPIKGNSPALTTAAKQATCSPP